jgi:hypothetical protein
MKTRETLDEMKALLWDDPESFFKKFDRMLVEGSPDYPALYRFVASEFDRESTGGVRFRVDPSPFGMD